MLGPFSKIVGAPNMTRVHERGARPGKVLVVGLGNPDRGDDGIGAAVAQALVGRLPPDAAVKVRRGDLLALIQDWEGFEAIVCIDAAAPMGVPGRICRVDLNSTALPRNLSFTSSHALGLPEAIELARSLQLAPRQIIVYAIEGASFDSGAPLTPAVAAAAQLAADQVVAEVGQLRCSTPEAAFDA
jgi:hydrogenase maturation protease